MRLRVLPLAVTLVLLALGLLVFGPSPVGGSSRVVVSSGTSMEPGISAGDLIVVSPRSSYEVGDVIAYRSEDLGTVLHRITGVVQGADGVEYLTQGDNNDFVDADQPRPADVLGAMRVRVPGGGRVLGMVPVIAAVAVVAYWKLADRRGRKGGPGTTTPGHLTPRRIAGMAAAVLFGALTVAATFSPTSTTRHRDAPFTVRTEIGWQSAVEPSVLYPDGQVDVTEPIFLREVDSLDVWATVTAGGAHQIAGDLMLVGELADDTGWSNRISISWVDLGSGGSLAGRVDLGRLRTTIDLATSRSGITPRSTTFALLVEGTVHGRIGDHAFEHDLDAVMPFALDELVLRPDTDATSDSAHESFGTVPVEEGVEAHAGIGPVTLPVGTARLVGPLGLLAGLVLAAWAPPSREPHEAINHRFAQMVVEVASAELPQGTPTVTVEHFDDLVRLAELEGSPILYSGDDLHHWCTLAMGVWYRYRLIPAEVVPSEESSDGRALHEAAT